MEDKLSVEQMIQQYILSAARAPHLLFGEKLYGQFLVVVYSTIDTVGLLDAPPNQMRASSHSFKAWVDKYLLPNVLGGEYNSTDLWAARCGVLHSFTTESDLSRSGVARQIQYYIAEGEAEKEHVEITRLVDAGAHAPAHLTRLGTAFTVGLHQFTPHLIAKCKSLPECAARLKNVLQIYPMAAPPNNSFKPKPLRGST